MTGRLEFALFCLRGRWLRVLTAIVAIALGTAGVCGVGLVHRAVLAAFVRVASGLGHAPALRVTRADGGLVSVRLLQSLPAVPGVASAIPLVVGSALTTGDRPSELTVFGLELGRSDVLGAYGVQDWAHAELNQGVIASHPMAVVITRPLAERHGLHLGDALDLDVPAGRRTFVVGGILTLDGGARFFGDDVAVVRLDQAQALFARPGSVSRIDVGVEPGSDVERVRRALAASLPAGLEVGTIPSLGPELDRAARSLGVMLYGAAIIGLTLSFVVALSRLSTHFRSRVAEMALMRAVGLRARAMRMQLVREGVVLGVAGVALGIPLGLLLARALLTAIAATAGIAYGQVVDDAAFEVRPWSLIVAAGVGLGAAIVAAVLAVWGAARTPVIDLLRPEETECDSSATRSRVLADGVLLVVALTLMCVPMRAEASGLAWTALGMLAVLYAARPALRLVRLMPFAARGPRAAVHLFAREGILRAPRRSALVVGMLAVGVGCVLWMATVARSFEDTFTDALAGTLRAELVVASARTEGGWLPAPVDEGLVETVRHVPDVAGAAGNRVVEWPHVGGAIGINAFDPAYFRDTTYGRPLLVGPRAPDVWTGLASGAGVLVSTTLAARLQLGVGDELVLDAPEGPLKLRVLGTMLSFISSGGVVEMSRTLYRRYWRDSRVNRVWVHTRRGAALDTVRAAIGEHLGRRGEEVRVFTSGELLDYLVSVVRRAFGPLRVAYAVVLLVLLLGLADGLVADVHARTPQLAMLRALGARRRQVCAAVRIESAMLGGLGLLLAAGLGLGLSWLWTRSTFRALMGWDIVLHAPLVECASVVILLAATCLVAAVVPAWHAARLSPALVMRRD